MSNLEKHAENEMRLAGFYDADSDYGGMIPEAVLKLVRALASEGHSGASHALTLEIFNRVGNFKTLTPITSNLSEWMDRGNNTWQNNRQSDCFSEDAGATWYFLDDPERKNWPKT